MITSIQFQFPHLVYYGVIWVMFKRQALHNVCQLVIDAYIAGICTVLPPLLQHLAAEVHTRHATVSTAGSKEAGSMAW